MLLAMAEIEKRMPEIKLPFLILHGDEDKLCLIDGSTIMQEKARSQDKTLSVSCHCFVDCVVTGQIQ